MLLLPASGFLRLFRIVTSFTIGHSLTLLLGSLNIMHLSEAWVEIAIAGSILVTAVHCLRPLFFGKEIFIAGGFGFIHGLAFAAVLSPLHLPPGPLALSILGFNLGIETMQLMVIAIIFPLLMGLSVKPWYRFVKNSGAALAILVSIFWIVEQTRMH